MFARARRPPRSMAGCWVLVTRATPAVGRRAGGAVKAAAVAAKATINFIVQNLSAGSFTPGSTDRERERSSVSPTLVSDLKNCVVLAYQ